MKTSVQLAPRDRGFRSFAAIVVLGLVACNRSDKSNSSSSDSGPPAAIAGSTTTETTPTSSSALTDGRYLIESAAKAGDCLAEEAESLVGIAKCNGDLGAQRWTLLEVSDGVYRVQSGWTGNVLDVDSGGTAAGTPVSTYSYGSGSANRHFRVSDVGSDAVQFEAMNAPGMCLAFGTAGGTELQACGSGTTRWLLYSVSQAPGIGRGLASSGCVAAPALKVSPVSFTTISTLGLPIDLNQEDLVGPDSWDSNYGRHPAFVAAPNGTGFDVLWKDQNATNRGIVVHLEPSGSTLAITRAWQVDLLGNLMGFAVGADGLRYYATGVDEGDLVSKTYPTNDVHRPNIVRVVGFDESGCVRLEVDLDLARGFFNADSAILINPMTAGSSRLAFGGGLLALVHGANTQPDGNGTRHQMARSTFVDVNSGEVVRASTQWVSHSFDVRAFWDGERFVETHLGDTYPRGIVFGRYGATDGNGGYLPFRAKGDGNATYTRLGGVASLASGDYGWLAVFSTERDGAVTKPRSARDLALVRVVRNFEQLDADADTFIDTTATAQTVTSGDTEVTNHVTWLTDYGTTASAADAAERPRVVALGGDRFLLLWEHWSGETFDGTYAMLVDGAGKVVKDATKLGTDHISRGDDALVVGGRGVLVSATGGRLVVTLVDEALTAERVEVQ